MQSKEIIKNNFSETRNLYVSKLFQTRPKRTFIEKKTMIIYSVISYWFYKIRENLLFVTYKNITFN